jgi:hypothetical protein
LKLAVTTIFSKTVSSYEISRALIIASSALVTSVSTAQLQPDPNRYEYSIAQFENQDYQVSPPAEAILLVGSSSIGFWNEEAIKNLLDQHPLPN